MNGPTSKPNGRDGKEAAANDGFSLPSIPLLKGRRAIRRIGEKFAVNPGTGAGSMTVPINTSRDASGFGPQPALFGYAVAVVAVGGAVVATLELGSAVRNTPTLFLARLFLAAGLAA
jgi:hypothetical protein